MKPLSFAVIGNPISHSLSPLIHQAFAQQRGIELLYERILGSDLFEQEVRDFFNQGGKGMNVTLPFKQRAFQMAQVCTPRCQEAGAANTLWMKEERLHADNTDGIGLIRDLKRYLDLKDQKILILGAGGAARGIIPPLLAQNIAGIKIAARRREAAKPLLECWPELQYSDLESLSGDYGLIINATSASLDGESVFLPLAVMEQRPFCYDLAYATQGGTPFVRYAKEFHCEAYDGLGMLIEQAAEAFFIWNGQMPETEGIDKLLL